MTKKKRILAIVFAFAFIFVMLFSTAFIIAESGHNCVGESCRICYQISVCENTLKQLSFGAITLAVFASAAYIAVLAVRSFVLCYAPATLITLKIKLSN
ncbi:MAG: hypothetical protein ACI4GA_06385 [Acutalibacteraceae bacterium]|nr:hypothetical protein [Oscillospiraceae bacterium]